MRIKARRNDCSEIPEHTWNEYTVVQGIECQHVTFPSNIFCTYSHYHVQVNHVGMSGYVLFSVFSSVLALVVMLLFRASMPPCSSPRNAARARDKPQPAFVV
jgi:hypothetical protein